MVATLDERVVLNVRAGVARISTGQFKPTATVAIEADVGKSFAAVVKAKYRLHSRSSAS